MQHPALDVLYFSRSSNASTSEKIALPRQESPYARKTNKQSFNTGVGVGRHLREQPRRDDAKFHNIVPAECASMQSGYRHAGARIDVVCPVAMSSQRCAHALCPAHKLQPHNQKPRRPRHRAEGTTVSTAPSRTVSRSTSFSLSISGPIFTRSSRACCAVVTMCTSASAPRLSGRIRASSDNSSRGHACTDTSMPDGNTVGGTSVCLDPGPDAVIGCYAHATRLTKILALPRTPPFRACLPL